MDFKATFQNCFSRQIDREETGRSKSFLALGLFLEGKMNDGKDSSSSFTVLLPLQNLKKKAQKLGCFVLQDNWQLNSALVLAYSMVIQS